jgi:uncharacterized DUF497 family protein
MILHYINATTVHNAGTGYQRHLKIHAFIFSVTSTGLREISLRRMHRKIATQEAAACSKKTGKIE